MKHQADWTSIRHTLSRVRVRLAEHDKSSEIERCVHIPVSPLAHVKPSSFL